MNQHFAIRLLAQDYKERSLNEADTRSLVIDKVIHDVLDWPKSAVKREFSVHPGYADYILHNASGQAALVVEAKREGIYFNIPKRKSQSNVTTEYISIKSLLTDVNVSAALNQARSYCLEIGCNFACITNGHEWIVFRVFEPGTDWKTLRAFVVPSLEAIDSCFTLVFNSLSYRCVSYDGALNALISRTPLENRETYRPGHEIPAYTRIIQANRYVQYLRPIAEKYFGVIDADQVELMNECYVSDSNYESAFQSAEALLTDSLTPFLETYGITDTANSDCGGSFGKRLEKSITRTQRADVVVLFGGKGIGKSTFLRRLLYVRPPQILKESAITVIVDLLNTPEDKAAIDEKIWQELLNQIDCDSLLNGDRDDLVTLFKDRFEIAKKQDLYGLPCDSLDYNKLLNTLLANWKNDRMYVAKRLCEHLHSKHKGVIVVIDNTDQYRAMQEYCFTHAQQIAHTLKCLVIVSMREERFYASSIRGVLDAFQNSGFHLSSPSPENVFLKRLEFVQRLLSNGSRRHELFLLDAPPQVYETIQTLLRNFHKEFRTPRSHLANFLSACAHGNIRLALELFRGMIQSPYTNIDEITSAEEWTWQVHQVLKPVMIPHRFFYEESESHIPNIFQLRSKKRSSHFTTLRILTALVNYSEIQGNAFFSLPQLFTELSNRFHMEEDQKAALDILLKHGLIEANNRLDEFAESIDSVRATAYGRHITQELSSAFTYLDLVSTDTALYDSRVSAELAKLAIEEYGIWNSLHSGRGKRIDRVEKRITKTIEFVEYLNKEEEREAEVFGLTPQERFVPRIRLKLDDEIESVRISSRRQRYR
jgi:hypothetical protein